MAEDERQAAGLPYGQLGCATYSQQDTEWIFSRQIGGSELRASQDLWPLTFPCLEQISHIEERIPGNEDDTSAACCETRPLPDHRLACLRALPQLRIASSLISRYHRESLASTEDLDQTIQSTELLAFGTAIRTDSRNPASHSASVSIAAFVTGQNGEILRLAYIQHENVQLQKDSFGQWDLRLPALSSKITDSWNNNAQAIRQVVFSPSSGLGYTWIAVRQDSTTTILHPRVLKDGRLDANPILTLPISRTGGHDHADVAFHPDDPLQIALVDKHGHWSIWIITDQKRNTRRAPFSIRLWKHGRLHPWNDRYVPRSSRPHYDGWHAVRWLRIDPTSFRLAVIDRRKIALVDPAGDPPIEPNLRLGPIGEGQWILAAKVLLDGRRLLVLTNSQLIWLSTPQHMKTMTKHLVEVHHSWRHFRSQSDTTLRLAVFEGNEGL